MKIFGYLILTFSLATLPSENEAICDNSWTSLQQTTFCIKYFSQSVTYDDALTNCKNDGGNLVSIHNAFENTAIRALTTDKKLLIGLQYDTNTQTFSWSDATDMDYENLESDFATKAPYFGNCVALSSEKKWTNVDCATEKLGYICKKQDTTPVTTQCPSQNEVYYDYGTVSSPGYPGSYNANLNCTYTLAAKIGHTVSITLVNHILETNDALVFYEFDQITMIACFGPATVCRGQVTQKNNFVSTGHIVYVVFQSRGTGLWEFTWHSLPDDVPHSSDQCPSKTHVYRDNGALYSPNSPLPYGTNETCVYLLSAPSDDKIVLTFTDLSLSTGDYVELYENALQEVTTPFASTSNNQIWVNTPITAPSSEVKMIFHSDTVGGGTWAMLWNSTIQCPISTYDVSTKGQIYSPGYPRTYSPLMRCTYLLRSINANRIHITFDEVSTDSASDMIKIYDGEYVTGTPIILSGNQSGVQFDSTGTRILVVFTSGSLIQSGYRWSATFNSFY